MTNPLHNFSMMLEALAELQPEIEAIQTQQADLDTEQAKLMPAPPSLATSLSELGPLPREALLLGLASDGLPVLLNLHDPHPGPVLIAADPGTGKTALLQLIAQAAAEMQSAKDVQFGVVTNYPDEWAHLTDVEHCVGIFPTYHDSAMDFFSSLSGWAHTNKGSQQSILLLLDDLESMNDIDFEVQQTLRWLLMRGTNRRVWPFVTLTAERAPQVRVWLDLFRTRIFGQIKNDRLSDSLTNVPETSLRHLQAGLQFALREGNEWLKFWIPEIN